MHSIVQLKEFINHVVSAPNPADKLSPTLVNSMMLTYSLQQKSVYFMTDPHGVLIQLGSDINLLCGFAQQEMLGLRLDEAFSLEEGVSVSRTGLIQEQRAKFYHPNGSHMNIIVKSRQWADSNQTGGMEGLICSEDRYHLSSLPANQALPLLSLSVSGGILSCNSGGRKLLSEWQNQLGGMVPEPMQDQLLDAWCGGYPMSFGSVAYFPMKKEGIVLLSSLPRYGMELNSSVNALLLHTDKQPDKACLQSQLTWCVGLRSEEDVLRTHIS